MSEMDPRTGKLERLTIRCACGYTVTWTKQAILAKAGPWRRPHELRLALRCSACGAKGPPKVSISGEGR